MPKTILCLKNTRFEMFNRFRMKKQTDKNEIEVAERSQQERLKNSNKPDKGSKIELNSSSDDSDSYESTIIKRCSCPHQLVLDQNLNQGKILYWSNKKSTNINRLQLDYSDAMNEFIIDFIENSFQNDLSVSINNSSQYILTTINNSQNCNLLMRAASTNNQEILQELLKLPFDVNQRSILGLAAADLAFQQQNFDILCLLLEHNSRFPSQFDRNAQVMKHEGIKAIVNTSKTLHFAIEDENLKNLIEILDENPNLMYFYNTTNQSAVAKAAIEEKFEIYKILLSKGRCIGPYEDVNDILGKLDKKPKRSLRDTHAGITRVSESHITTILSRCSVSHDDQNVSQRHQLIYELLKDINQLEFNSADGLKVPFGNFLLRLIAAYGNFKIFLDFNRVSVQHMDPLYGEKDMDGLFYFNGHIYIGAKELIDEKTRHKVTAAIVHEMSHLAISTTFNNNSKPYEYDDKVKEAEFREIIESYKNMKHEEDIMRWVFDYFTDESWPSELIVRPAQLMANYHQNPMKLFEIRMTYENLFEYFERFLTPKLIETLEILEKLAQNDSKMTFSNLTEPLKDKIMQNYVEFQGQFLKLFNVVDKSSRDAIINHLKPSEMLKMINKTQKELKIGEILENKKENREIYIERDFIDFDFDTSEENMTFESVWEPRVIEKKKSFEEIVSEASSSKILLLSDAAGAGKTTIFSHLNNKLKKNSPNNWISYVDLKQHLRVYEKYSEGREKTKKDDVEILTEVLKDILEIKNDFDFAIFNHLFGLNKVILLLDGVDEISPNFKDFFINLVLKIKNYSKNQVWIATRPEHMKELKEKFKIKNSFKLLPWDKEEHKKFIENILKIRNIEKIKAEDVYLIIRKVLDTKNLSNPLLLKMFIESYLIDDGIGESNLFSLYQKVIESKKKVLNEEKGEIANADRDNESRMTIFEVHQVYALKAMFEDSEIKVTGLEESLHLEHFSIMQKWQNEKSKWSPEKISRYGFLYVDNWNSENESCEFIHRTVAEFFISKYFIESIYEFGNQDLSYKEAERRLAILVFISDPFSDHTISNDFIFNFIQSYLETGKYLKILNEQFLKCLKNDFFQSFMVTNDFDEIIRFLRCFWRHSEALRILFIPENNHEGIFQRLFYQPSYDYFESMSELIELLEKCFGDDWPDLTGYKKINQNEKFQHLTHEDLESYSELTEKELDGDSVSKNFSIKALIKLLSFIPQMQIPEEHLEEFLKNHFCQIAMISVENFLKSDIHEKFKLFVQSHFSKADILKYIKVNLSNEHIEDKSKMIKFFSDFCSPEINFKEEILASNTVDTENNFS